MCKTIGIKDFFEKNPTSYLILKGELTGSTTTYYPDAQDDITNNITWNFSTNPTINSIESAQTFVLISKNSTDTTGRFYNIQSYEFIHNVWRLSVGAGILSYDDLNFTFTDTLNGSIKRTKNHYKIERFIYASQNVFNGLSTIRINAFADFGKFKLTNKNTFETETGYTLRSLE
jgi:hypothetical protein